MGLNFNPLDAAKSVVKAGEDVVKGGAKTFDGALDAAKNAVTHMSAADIGHMALDGVGMIPVVGEAADLANGAWYAAEGDWANAALSGAAAIPFAGNAATGVKWAKRGVEAAETIAKGVKTADKAVDAGKTIEKAAKAEKTVAEAGKVEKGAKGADDVAKGEKAAKTADDAPKVKKRKAEDEPATEGKAGKQARTEDAAKTDDAAKVTGPATIHGTEGKNKFTWNVDEKDRFTSGKAEISEDFAKPGSKRASTETDAQKAAADMGKAGDQGGHMFAYRFTLEKGGKNLVPQNGNLNTGAWKKMENEFADWVKDGKRVDAEVTAKRVGDSDRPDSFRVSYKVVDPESGKTIYKNTHRFSNEAGETFDRVSAKDIKKLGAEG